MSELIAGTQCPVLGQFGEADHVMSVDSMLAWRNAFEQANKSYRIRVYPDAPHGWFNDTMPGGTVRSRPPLHGATCSRSSKKRSAPVGTPAA